MQLQVGHVEVKSGGRRFRLPVIYDGGRRIPLDLIRPGDNFPVRNGSVRVDYYWCRIPMKKDDDLRVEVYRLIAKGGVFLDKEGRDIGSYAYLYRSVGVSGWMVSTTSNPKWKGSRGPERPKRLRAEVIRSKNLSCQ